MRPMKQALKFLIIISFGVILLTGSRQSYAQTATASANTPKLLREDYFKAEVVEILDQEKSNASGKASTLQTLGLSIASGYEKGKDISLIFESFNRRDAPIFKKGDKVIVQRAYYSDKTENYQIVDRYRLDSVLTILIAFLLLVVLMSGKKGIGSIFGMGFSLAVLLFFVTPLIVSGYSPLVVSIFGALFIMLVSIYLAHGVSKQTTSAVISTFVSLVLSGIVSYLFVALANLHGVGSEDSYSLQFALTNIDLKGLLLGGIIIGTLGILDDVTTTQSAVIFELNEANPKLTYKNLVKMGLDVGREHITALVNTLFLVYAGVSLGLFVIFVLNPLNQPAWVLLNYESMSEEIIRTITGSLVLVLAVPISTVIAAFTVKKYVKHKKTGK